MNDSLSFQENRQTFNFNTANISIQQIEKHNDVLNQTTNVLNFFELNGHNLMRGDALKILRTIPDNSVNLIFVDPPYNIGKNFNGYKDKWENDEKYMSWCYEWIDLCIQKLKDNGSMYLMGATQFMPYFDTYLRKKMDILARIIWHYDSSGVQAKKFYGSLYEPIIFAVKGKGDYVFNSKDILVEAKTGAKRKLIDYRKSIPTIYNSKKVPGNVWYFPRVRFKMSEYETHPSQKPESLLNRIILASSNVGDVVLDPFSGTFTTSAVAMKLNRKSIGIELDKDYFETGVNRLQNINKSINNNQKQQKLGVLHGQ
ncbi:MAG: adenine-specific DNA-methyltransferase [Nanoarchaeota archaeon]|nr:adenine-specific DNA-methyltransferase [Nanoarchaeota archaeon]MBU4452313.1 adenine-specific DNA-methyltransferase [Nanoarchaeota archaeon]